MDQPFTEEARLNHKQKTQKKKQKTKKEKEKKKRIQPEYAWYKVSRRWSTVKK